MATNLRRLERTDPNPSVPAPLASVVGRTTGVSWLAPSFPGTL